MVNLNGINGTDEMITLGRLCFSLLASSRDAIVFDLEGMEWRLHAGRQFSRSLVAIGCQHACEICTGELSLTIDSSDGSECS